MEDELEPSPPIAPSRKKKARGPQQKKRKVNTCEACKTRKVKCDRAKPYCGQCVKHFGDQVSVSCIFPPPDPENDADDAAVESQIGLGLDADPRPPSWNNNLASQQPPPSDTNALLERILRLESALQRSGSSLPDSLNDQITPIASSSNHPQQPEQFNSNRPWNFDGGYQDNDQNQSLSYQEGGMVSNVNENGNGNGNQGQGIDSSIKEPPLSDTVRFPFPFKPTNSRIQEVLSFLPETSTMDFLLESYSTIEKTSISAGLSWRLIMMQLDILRNQLNAGYFDYNNNNSFDDSRNGNGNSSNPRVDFSFLALLFILLAQAIEWVDLEPLVARGIAANEDNAVDIMQAWVQVSEACLCMADFMSKPNLNIMMALSLLRQLSGARSLPAVRVILSMSIRLAQTLGLHRLGTAKEDETRWLSAPVEDNRKAFAERIDPISSRPAAVIRGRDVEAKLLSNMSDGAMCGIASVFHSSPLIVDRSHLVRETGRKIWASLVASDYYMSSGFGDDQYQINNFSTGLPLNIDEKDLPDANGPNPFNLPRELPPGSPSESSIFPYNDMIVKVGKEASLMGSESGKLDYEQTMIIDSNFRKIFDSLPTFLRLDGVSENLPEVRLQLIGRPYLAVQRLILHESIFNRLTLLHRHFLARGHRNSQFQSSVEQCVKAAKMVLYCRRELDRIAPFIMRFFVFRIHVFLSIAALCIHLIELARQQIYSTEASEIRKEITEALSFLNKSGPRGTDVPTPKASNDIIDALLRAELQVKSNENNDSNHGRIGSSNQNQNKASNVRNGKRKARSSFSRENPNENSNGNQSNSNSNPSQGNALEDILSPNDPLNLYINSLLDPSTSEELSPPNFFDILDGFVPTM